MDRDQCVKSDRCFFFLGLSFGRYWAVTIFCFLMICPLQGFQDILLPTISLEQQFDNSTK